MENSKNKTKQERSERLDNALIKIGGVLTKAESLQEKLTAISESLMDITKADGTSIWLIEENERILICKAAAGIYERILGKFYRLDEKGVTPNIVRTGKSVLSKHFDEHKKKPGHVGKFDEELFVSGQRCESFMQVPLRIGEKIIGVVKADSTKTDFFSEENDSWLFKYLAATSAIIINNEQGRETRVRAERLDIALREMGGVLTKAVSLPDKLTAISRSLMDITNADGTSIWLIEENEGILICKAAAGIYERILGKSYRLDEKGVTPNIVRTGESVLSKRFSEHEKTPNHAGKFDKELFGTGKRCESFMQVPLRIGEKTIGVVKADSTEPDFFSEENDSWLFNNLAVVTAIVIRNDQERDKMEKGKKDMAAIAVHNLDNPSTSIRNALDNMMLLLQKDKFNSEKFEHIITSAKNQIEEILVTREIFLTFTNPKRGKDKKLDFSLENLREFINNIFDTLKTEKQKVDLKINLSKEIENIQMLKLQISLALNNIIKNALEAMFNVKEKKINIDIKLVQETGNDYSNLILNISDNGCGIPDDDQNKLFTAGFSTKGLGSGLGLYAGQKIMQNVGGDLTFVGSKNNITTFRLTCPCKIKDLL